MHAGYGNTVYMSLTSLAFKKNPFKMIFFKKCVSLIQTFIIPGSFQAPNGIAV